MQELYYQQLKDRDVGPFSANQVRQMIRAGKIQASDRLRIDNEALAHPAGEYLAFRQEIEQTAAQETNGRRWVCMRAGQMKNGSTAAMCGPYTRKELVSELMHGHLKPTDYVWREGFTSWKTLDSVDQLQLPIPRTTIKWNSGALDWNTPQPLPSRAPVQSTRPVTTMLADRALDAGIILVCGLFAIVVWKLAFTHHSLSPRHAAGRAPVTAKPSTMSKPVQKARTAAPKAPAPQARKSK